MKKIITVLFAVLAMSSMFAKSITLKFEGCFLVADDERKPNDYNGMSDDEILARLIYCMPKEVNGRNLIYLSYKIKDIDYLAKKYNNYLLVDDEQTVMRLGENLSDGRMMIINYMLKKIDK